MPQGRAAAKIWLSDAINHPGLVWSPCSPWRSASVQQRRSAACATAPCWHHCPTRTPNFWCGCMSSPGGMLISVSEPNFLDFRQLSRALEQIVALANRQRHRPAASQGVGLERDPGKPCSMRGEAALRAGAAGAWALSHGFDNLLLHRQGSDWWVFLLALLVLGVVAFTAIVIPARRVLGQSPLDALRGELSVPAEHAGPNAGHWISPRRRQLSHTAQHSVTSKSGPVNWFPAAACVWARSLGRFCLPPHPRYPRLLILLGR